MGEEEREILKGVATDEQETVVQFGRNDEYMTIYTTDSTMMTKLDKCVKGGEYEVIEIHKLQKSDKIIGKTYKAKKRLLSFRKKFIERELTKEQKLASAERLKNYNTNRNS